MGKPKAARPLTVCLILEGSYPFITGGVSAWVQELISALPEIRFVLYTLSPRRDQPVRYTLPPNVAGHMDIVLHERRRSSARARGNKAALVREIRGLHAQFAARTAPDLTGRAAAHAAGVQPRLRQRAPSGCMADGHRGERRAQSRLPLRGLLLVVEVGARHAVHDPREPGPRGGPVPRRLHRLRGPRRGDGAPAHGQAVPAHRARPVPQGTGDGDQAGQLREGLPARHVDRHVQRAQPPVLPLRRSRSSPCSSTTGAASSSWAPTRTRPSSSPTASTSPASPRSRGRSGRASTSAWSAGSCRSRTSRPSS